MTIPSPVHSLTHQSRPPYPDCSSSLTSSSRQLFNNNVQQPLHSASPLAIGSAANNSPTTSLPLKHDQRKPPVTVSIASIRSTSSTPSPAQAPSASSYFDAAMGKRKDRLESVNGLSPANSPRPSNAILTRPITPSSPVQIPKRTDRQTAHPQKRHTTHRRKPLSHVQSPNDISPSLAALLAVTDIPRQRSIRRPRGEMPLTVDQFTKVQHVSEKELSWSLSRGPMDVLLSPPDESVDDDNSISDCNIGSAMSMRTVSMDSVPSLGGSSANDNLSFLDTPGSPSPSMRRRIHSPVRRSLEPVLSPPGEYIGHPLAWKHHNSEDLVHNPLPESVEEEEEESLSLLLGQLKPLRYAFKSNLTASLRALRSAAKSLSTINFSSIPSDDFLTRSLLTIDTKVPYVDERRPPVMEDVPSAEVRRYLNPISSARIATQLATVPPQRAFTASIQMQTYKIQRSKLGSGRDSQTRSSPQSSSSTVKGTPTPEAQTIKLTPPAIRPREMRENSDFIRIAVMEMAMRKHGKLDDQRPGRARWTLPPRRATITPYKVAANGIPARWRSISY